MRRWPRFCARGAAYHCKDLLAGQLRLLAQFKVFECVQAFDYPDEFPLAIKHVCRRAFALAGRDFVLFQGRCFHTIVTGREFEVVSWHFAVLVFHSHVE